MARAAASGALRIALVLAPAIVGVLGMVLELALRRTYGKDPLYALLLTFGAAIVIEEAIRVIWGSRERVLPTPEALQGAVVFGDLLFARYRFYAAGARRWRSARSGFLSSALPMARRSRRVRTTAK